MEQKPKRQAARPKHLISPETLQHVGRTLFGVQWRGHVARLLKVDRQTIDKWMTDGAPGWIAAHLEKVGYAKYDEKAKLSKKLDDAVLGKLSNCNDALYSERCQYLASRGLPKPSLLERHKQVATPTFPKIRK
jgi:hypothetical protein